jgi:hypothetical protein
MRMLSHDLMRRLGLGHMLIEGVTPHLNQALCAWLRLLWALIPVMPSSLGFIHWCLEPSSLGFIHLCLEPSSLGFIHLCLEPSSTWTHSPHSNPVENIFLIVFVNSFGPFFWLRLMQGDNIVLPMGPSWCHILWAKQAMTQRIRTQSSPTNHVQFSIFHKLKYDWVPMSHRITFITLKISLGNKQTNTLSWYEL